MAKNKKLKSRTISFILIIMIIMIISFTSFFIKYEDVKISSMSVSGDDGGILKTEIKNYDNTELSLISCQASGIYNFCTSSDNIFSDVTAFVEIQSIKKLDDYNTYKGSYYVGNVYLPYKVSADKVYLYDSKNLNSWDSLWNVADCDKLGCYNYEEKIINEDKILIGKKGDELNKCPVIVGFDFEKKNTAWSWNIHGFGYINNCISGKVVECYDNLDCIDGFYCDNSQDWQNWECKQKKCETGDVNCKGSDFEYCGNYEWINEGKVISKCGVECEFNSDCSNLNLISDDFYCEGNKLFTTQNTGECNVINKCDVKIDKKLVQNCQFGCNNGICKDEPVISFGNNYCNINNIMSDKFEDGIKKDTLLIESCQDGFICNNGICEKSSFLSKIYQNKSVIFLILGVIFVVIYVYIRNDNNYL